MTTTTKPTTWALVPAKDFARGKSRLGPALAADARRAFAEELLRHVLATLRATVDGVVVATDSVAVAAVAHECGAETRRDLPAENSLAAVVDAGLATLANHGAARALVLMADLPLITGDDLRQLIDALDNHDVAIARASDGCHTNALGLAPPTCLPTAFGHARSFEAHLEAARARRLRVAIIDNERLAFDVDAPSDFAQLQKDQSRAMGSLKR